MELKVLNFMRQHKDWEEQLAAAPYFIKTKWDGKYCILKYNQFDSDFSNPIVKECRGIIFYIDNEIIPVCIPFFKFHNYGEEYADSIDWSTSTVSEKIDGSLMKIWYHKGWHLSTNGSINAFETNLDGSGFTFGNLFNRVINFDSLCFHLDTNYTYMFELTTPENQVVIPYDDAIWYLGRRNNITLKEDKSAQELQNIEEICYPYTYSLYSLEDCIAAASELTKDEEGYVVSDANFNRIKVKSPAWIAAAHLHNNKIATPKYIITMYKDETLDDYLGNFPDEKKNIDKVLNDIHNYIYTLDNLWNDHSLTLNEIIQMDSPHKDYLFGRLKGKWFNGAEYVKKLTAARLIKVLGYAD